MAAHIADRLTTQEEQIRGLSDEIGRLLELGLQGTIECEPSPALEQLRAENERLKYRLAHLQRSLKEEQERGRPEESPGLEDRKRPEDNKERPGDNNESPGLEDRERPGDNKERPGDNKERPGDNKERPREPEKPQTAGDKGEEAVSENQSVHQNSTKKGKKAGGEADGGKQQPLEQM